MAMDYFRKYLGAPQAGGLQPTGAETVERLVERAQSSTLLDDRRDAVRALKAMSKKFRLEVGTQAMDVLIKTLEVDRIDTEITGYALDALCNVMSNEPSEDEDENQADIPSDLGNQFSEIFTKKHENVALLLELLDEYDFHVRWPTVKLITILLANKGKEIQEIILVSPMGVSKLMDLLSDSREIIRNDALLLLIQLTRNNANIQKIVAFENAFERILSIVTEEGDSDGGIVVEDCLLLLLNLLKNNSSNQNFFRESSYIQRLTHFFDLQSDGTQQGWSAQKVSNIHRMLQLIRTLVSPNSPQQQMTACQRTMHQCGLLKQLCSILMASGVPADVLTETINTVAEVIRGNLQNQEYFASVLAPSNPPRPAIVVLLMSMVNERQPFSLRCAVLYCFQSFLYKNEVGQSQIVQTLLPTSADSNTISAGQLLCGGLFSGDSLSNWFAAVAMMHAIQGNPTQQEQLLRVQLATSLGSPPVSLQQQCCNILAQGGKFQTRIGLLMLLCAWLAESPIAVAHFLSHTANVPYLITQVTASDSDEHEMLVQGLCAFLLGILVYFNDDQNETFSKTSLRQIIEKRIGLETFTDKLSQIFKHEFYTRAAKKPNLNYKQANEVVFDYEFTRLFKNLENEVLKAVSPTTYALENKDKMDHELTQTKQQLEQLQHQHVAADKELQELRQQVQQLRDQNALLKAQKGSGGDVKKDEEIKQLQAELEMLKIQGSEKDALLERLKKDLTVSEARLLSYSQSEDDKSSNEPGDVSLLHATVNRLNIELDESQKTLHQREEDLSHLQVQLSETSEELRKLQDKNSEASSGDLASLQEELEKVRAEKATLQERLKKSNEENLKTLDKFNKSKEEVSRIDSKKREVEEELENLRKEQEDLLVLLADQDTKIDKYKSRLKELGEQIEDDDDDDDDLGDDEVDEDED